MRRSSFAAVLLILTAALAAGCRRRVAAAPARVQLVEEHCWWAVMRSTLPPDSVAARFERAFTAVGLTGAARTRQADTAWAHAGPTLLGGPSGATYAGRAVAYWHGDSTHFRYYLAAGPARAGRAQPAADTVDPSSNPASGRRIALCGEIARAAAIGGSVPRDPTGDEGLDVWTRTRVP